MSRILLIDADPGDRRVVESRLIEQGHGVTTAETGAKGLVEAREGAFELVLVAAELGGGVDGAEVCRRIKAVPQLSALPVLIYTDRAVGAEVTARMYDSGCEGFVSRSLMPDVHRLVEVQLRHKARCDELSEQNRLLEHENRRLDEERQRLADLEASAGVEGVSSLVFRELAAGRPDGVLVVDGSGVVRQADRGAHELFGKGITGSTLGRIAPASGLEAFARDARTAPREGFRFDISPRKDRAQRSLMASVVPVAASAGEGGDGLRVLLLVDLGRRRVAEEMLRTSEPGIPRQQLGSLLEAARATYTPAALVGHSPATRALAQRLEGLAAGGDPVLLVGEPGTGKALAARVLHYSGRSTGSFMELCCASLSADSLEHELFGHAKDAFPGALADRPGLLLLALDGTLYLDGLEELPLAVQKRLAGALEEGAFQRPGSRRRERLGCRIVASTTRAPAALVKEKRLAPALQRALRAQVLALPPLRERPGDPWLLARALVERLGPRHGVSAIAPEVESALERYAWPGNVDELEACIEEACARAAGGPLTLAHLPHELAELGDRAPARDLIPALRPASQASDAPAVEGTHVAARAWAPVESKAWAVTEDDPISLDHYEKKALLRALDHCDGDKLEAARLLQVGKSTLYRKLKKYGIR